MTAIETLISVFTVDKGEVKVLLFRKKTEPYRGYWILPGGQLEESETLEENISDVINDKIGFKAMNNEQHHVYSALDRSLNERLIGISFIGLIDSKSVEIKRELKEGFETQWFSIDAIPKMAFDHNNIISDAVEALRRKMINSNVLKSLFPSDFTLPELQNVYEQILNKQLDRRNFRKKFINFGLIEDTGYKNEAYTGRPAKLYKFKEEIKVRDLF